MKAEINGLIIENDDPAGFAAAFIQAHYEPDLATVRSWALTTVRQLAAERENQLDALVAGSRTRAIMLNTEITNYWQSDRPADPNPAVYAIANSLATRRGATLRATLEGLFTRWQAVRDRIVTITTELDRLEEEIAAASTVTDIEAAMAGIDWGA
jgi:hypothetical protein